MTCICSRLALVAAIVLITAVGCTNNASTGSQTPSAASDDDHEPSAAKRRSLVMIPKATQAAFWNAVRRGAERAAAESNVDLTWKGPSRDNDRTEQKKLIQQFLNEGYDGILLAPLDNVILVPEARAAKQKGIPLVIFDSAMDGAPGEDFVSFVATDNLEAGRMGGKHLMKLVGEGGKTILFRHMEGQQSTDHREAGALEEMKAAKAEILIDNRYTGRDANESQRAALNMIDAIREADGIFASNQTSSEGLVIALRKNNLAGKVKVVGFDSSPELVQALVKGDVNALVLQDPETMGYTAVQTMVAHLDGKPVDPVINTACRVVTKENMNEAAIKPLLQ